MAHLDGQYPWFRKSLACALSMLIFCCGGFAYGQNQSTESRLGTIDVIDPILKTIETTMVASEVAGLLEKVSISEGDRVAVSEELTRVRDDSIRLQTQRSRSVLASTERKLESNIDIEIAEKTLLVATNEYQRVIDANKELANVYPIKEVERLRLTVEKLELEKQRALLQRELLEIEKTNAQIDYRQNRLMMQKHRVKAPCAGLIVSVFHRPGEWVEQGAKLVEIVEIDRLRIEGFVDHRLLEAELVGSEASVQVESNRGTITSEAKVVFVSPEINPLNSQVRVFLEVDNRAGKLRPGMIPVVSIKVP
jgi:multidrug efflux pump subunit AcrA (membrane-fusion protein)